MICRGELKRLERAARDQGWTLSRTNGGHLRFLSPSGSSVITSSTPSDHRTYLNARARLRRLGLSV